MELFLPKIQESVGKMNDCIGGSEIHEKESLKKCSLEWELNVCNSRTAITTK